MLTEGFEIQSRALLEPVEPAGATGGMWFWIDDADSRVLNQLRFMEVFVSEIIAVVQARGVKAVAV